MNTQIKTFFFASIIISFLSACQSLSQPNGYADYENLPRSEAEFLKRTADIQKAASGLKPQRIIYFDKDWAETEAPDTKGYFRKSYGLQDNGLYLLQDFFHSGKKQTSLFYGNSENNGYTSNTQGYIALYNEHGQPDSIEYIINSETRNSHVFCSAKLCAQHKPEFFAVFKNNRKILERQWNIGQDGNITEQTVWYENGKKAAYRQEKQADENGSSQLLQNRYWLEDGSESSTQPDTQTYHALIGYIKQIESAKFGESEDNDSQEYVGEHAGQADQETAKTAAEAASER